MPKIKLPFETIGTIHTKLTGKNIGIALQEMTNFSLELTDKIYEEADLAIQSLIPLRKGMWYERIYYYKEITKYLIRLTLLILIFSYFIATQALMYLFYMVAIIAFFQYINRNREFLTVQHGNITASIIGNPNFAKTPFCNKTHLAYGIAKNAKVFKFDIYTPIEKVIKNQEIKIVNFSSFHCGLWPKINYYRLIELAKNDKIVVVAAGNQGINLKKIPFFCQHRSIWRQIMQAAQHPKYGKKIIIVSAYDGKTNAPAPFSNYLEAPTNINYITAPGTLVPANTLNMRKTANILGRNLYNTIEYFGTSLSAPYVSGVLGLLYEAHPHYTPEEIIETLMKSCTQPKWYEDVNFLVKDLKQQNTDSKVILDKLLQYPIFENLKYIPYNYLNEYIISFWNATKKKARNDLKWNEP